MSLQLQSLQESFVACSQVLCGGLRGDLPCMAWMLHAITLLASAHRGVKTAQCETDQEVSSDFFFSALFEITAHVKQHALT